jgi:hypothetical protein
MELSDWMHIFLKAPLPPKERLRRQFFHGSGAHKKKRKGKRRRISTLRRPLSRRHLYSPSPLRHGPRVQRMDWLDHRLPQKCPVPLCEYCHAEKDQMRRHWDESFQIEGETGYDKCERCMKYVQTRRLANHQQTKLCHNGNLRNKISDLTLSNLLPLSSNDNHSLVRFRFGAKAGFC